MFELYIGMDVYDLHGWHNYGVQLHWTSSDVRLRRILANTGMRT